MDGYYQFKQLIERTKSLNLTIYDVLDNQIGQSIFKLKNKEIKKEEFEDQINNALKQLKTILTQENMVKTLDQISQENDVHTLS